MFFALLDEISLEKIEVLHVDVFGCLLFRSHAKIAHACQQRVDRPDVLLDSGGSQRFDERPLLGDLAFLAVLGERELLLQLGGEIGFEAGCSFWTSARITDAFLCFPPLVFILAMSAALGPGLHNVILSFALFGWTGFARIIRGQVLLVRELPFVEAARAVGVSPARVMWRHILPNTLAPIIVAVSITVGTAILVESGVSFLGLGVQPPTASWGKELRVGFTYLEKVPLFSLAPGLMITLAVIGFNFLGDGLRDALDPRLKGSRQT